MKNDLITDKLGFPGRLLSGSKLAYEQAHPGHVVVFNANLMVDGQKVWYGDIDITVDEAALKAIAQALGKVHILYEMDARFETEASPVLENAVYWTDGTACGFAPRIERERRSRRLYWRKS